MGWIHNALTRGNWSAAVKKALGATKSEGGIERFGETMTPLINLWERPEWAVLRDELLWMAVTSQAGVAAEFSFGAVLNPAGSNMIVVVTDVNHRANATTDTVVVGINTQAEIEAQATTTANCALRDSRRGGATGGAATARTRIITGAHAGAGFTNATENFTAASRFSSASRATPLVITPGFGVTLQHTVVNLFLGTNFVGYERQALPGELV